MESPRLRLLPLVAALLFLLPLLGTLAQEDAELQPRALDIYSAVEDASHEKQLVCIPPRPRLPWAAARFLPLCASFLSPCLPTPIPKSGPGEVGTDSRLPLLPTGSGQSVERIPDPGPSEQQESPRLLDLRSVRGTALAEFPPLEHPSLWSAGEGCVWFWGSL